MRDITLVDLLCTTKLECSKSAAKRLIKSGGCKINDNIVVDIDYIINLEDLKNNHSCEIICW